MDEIVDQAVSEASQLANGGLTGILVENFGDTPFFPCRVPSVTASTMAVLVREVVRATSVPVGVNVLRNDAGTALGVALAAGAQFIRVNVHTGAMFTDQGLIQGQAHDTLRLRANLGANVSILADILVKHAVAPPGLSVEAAARDTWSRGRADGVVLTGEETGCPVRASEVDRVRKALPAGAKIWVGSGADPDNAGSLRSWADGIIVGSALRQGGLAGAPLDPRRIDTFMAALQRK
jgi:membrane complex biogenesis BtpA family protein